MRLPDWPDFVPMVGAGIWSGALRAVDVGQHSQTSSAWLRFWNYDGSGQVGRLNDAVVFDLPKIGASGRTLRIVGDPGDGAEELRVLLESFGVATVVDALAKRIGALKGFHAIADRRLTEYEYGTSRQIELSGKDFRSVRGHLNVAMRRGDWNAVVRRNVAPSLLAELLAVFDSWAEAKPQSETVRNERSALLNAMRSFEVEPLYVVVIRDSCQVLEAFSVFTVHSDFAHSHFLKVRRPSSPLYALTWNATVNAASRLGAETINYGYDGGLEGLRTSKMGLHPDALLGISQIVCL